MSHRRYRLTATAPADIENTLDETARLFGPIQYDRYTLLIAKAAQMIVENPERVGSRHRHDLAAGLRSFHMELAADRSGAASHTIYYVHEPATGDVLIVRVLHEKMEPIFHITGDVV